MPLPSLGLHGPRIALLIGLSFPAPETRDIEACRSAPPAMMRSLILGKDVAHLFKGVS